MARARRSTSHSTATSPLSASPATTERWWGRYTLLEGTYGHWKLGPLSLWMLHTTGEWRAAYEQGSDVLDSEVRVQVPTDAVDLYSKPHVARFATSRCTDTVVLMPALADRAVVVRPEKPLYILPGDEVRIYFSAPLWVQLSSADAQRILLDIPTFRLSDTWFGPSAGVLSAGGLTAGPGELCYALRTHARLTLAEVPRRQHRVLSAARIRNRADDPLLLERLNVDVRRLSLYLGADGNLWTQSITLERLEGKDLASLHLDRGPPREAASATLVAAPRQKQADGLLVRALGSLFQ